MSKLIKLYTLSVVDQSLSHVWLFVTPQNAACQTSLSLTFSQSLLKLMSIESMVPSNHLILCQPFLLLPSIFPRVRGISSGLALCIRWPKYWCFSLSISPSSEYSGFLPDWLVWSPWCPRNSQECSPAQFKNLNSSGLSLLYGPPLTPIRDYWKNNSFDYKHFCQQSDVSAF